MIAISEINTARVETEAETNRLKVFSLKKEIIIIHCGNSNLLIQMIRTV
jgi:hypothetical protein